MKKLIAILMFLILLCPVICFAESLWLPEGFSWEDDYYTVLNKAGGVFEMNPVNTSKGICRGILSGTVPIGYMFTFYDNKLVGVSVAYHISYTNIPEVRDIKNKKGYTKTSRVRSGNWIFIESGLSGYYIITWENGIGILIGREEE